MLLQTEEQQLGEEIMQKLQREEEDRLQEKKNKLLIMKQEQEQKRADLVKNKMIQLQLLVICDQARLVNISSVLICGSTPTATTVTKSDHSYRKSTTKNRKSANWLRSRTK